VEDPLDTVDWPVRTERLVIRRATFADAGATWTYRQLEEVCRWIPSHPRDVAAHASAFTDPVSLAMSLVVELATEERPVIGDLMVRVTDAWAQREVAEQARQRQAELGWSLHPAYGGRGYATEAVRAAIDLCFGPLELHRVIAECFADNEPSWRLMERVGMRREAHTRQDSLHRSLGWLDGYTYALLAEEHHSKECLGEDHRS